MSTYSLQVPEGLMPIHCERPGSEYGDVPIRYIMPQISEEDIRKKSIRLPNGNKLFVTVDENPEMYLRMLRDADNLRCLNGSKKEFQDAHADLRKKFNAYRITYQMINPTTAQKALAITQKVAYKEAQAKCREHAVSAFSLFRRMLDGIAKEQWDLIDIEVHTDSIHTDLQGLTVKGPLQRSWATFDLCIEKHKLHVFNVDAADVQRRYLSQGVRKPFEVKIKWFMMRMMAMNRDLTLMPCLALNTQTSKEVVPTNVPFNGAEMCSIIIRCLPQDWQTQYHMANGQKVQTKTRELLIQLEAIEKAMDQKRKEKDASTKKDSTAKSGKNGKGSEKRRSTGSGDSFRIPKKQRTDKFCNRCKEHGGAHTTHNTNDCNRYKADGTPNKEYGAKSKFAKKGNNGKDKSYKKGGWDKQSISHLTAELDSVKKQLKKMKKSRGKKRKRHGRHQSSDSSSGSDSSE